MSTPVQNSRAEVANSTLAETIARIGAIRTSLVHEPSDVFEAVKEFVKNSPKIAWPFFTCSGLITLWLLIQFSKGLVWFCSQQTAANFISNFATSVSQVIVGTETAAFIGVLGTLVAMIIGFLVAVLVDARTTRDLKKTAEKLEVTHKKLDGLARLKPITSFRDVLDEIDNILCGCVDDKPDGAIRNLYVLNPTEWFGTTMSFNLDVFLECDTGNRANVLMRSPGMTCEALGAKMIELRDQIDKSRKKFVNLVNDPRLSVHYAVLAPSDDPRTYKQDEAELKLYMPQADGSPDDSWKEFDKDAAKMLATIFSGADIEESVKTEITSKIISQIHSDAASVNSIPSGQQAFKSSSTYREYLKPLVESDAIVEPIGAGDVLKYAGIGPDRKPLSDSVYVGRQVYLVPDDIWQAWKGHELHFHFGV